MGARAAAANNLVMTKPSHIYGWDEEPIDERPSEFMASTGYSVLSGYAPLNDPMRKEHPRGRFGFKTMLVFCVVLLALGACAIAKLVPLLRG